MITPPGRHLHDASTYRDSEDSKPERVVKHIERPWRGATSDGLKQAAA